MINTSQVGDISNAIAAASVFAYTIATFLYASTESKVSLFDDRWIQYGFCVTQPLVPYWNSHDLCFYFDTILVIIGLFIYNSHKGLRSPGDDMKTADELMFFNLLGHFGHGVAHASIAAKFRSGEIDDGNESFIEKYQNGEDDGMIAQFLLIGFGFWVGILKGVVPTVPIRTCVIMAIPILLGSLLVKANLGFAYVQAVITVVFVSTQLTLPKEKKSFVYAAFAVSFIPVALIPWVESMACDSIASKLGGHLIFDVSIPLSLYASYLASWHHYSSVEKKGKAE